MTGLLVFPVGIRLFADDDLGEGIRHQGDHRDNEYVDGQCFDKGQTDGHADHDFRTSARIAGDALNRFVNADTLTDAATQGSDCRAEACHNDTPRKVTHLLFSFFDLGFIS